MSNWLVKKLIESKNYSSPKYAFNSTVNWMKALRLICEKSVNKESLDDFYKNVNKINTNEEYVIKAIARIYSSLIYLQTLKSLIRHENNTNNSVNAHIAVVSWYYCIYDASKALIAICNNSYQETHAQTAKVLHDLVENQKLFIEPFNYFLSDITSNKVDEQISAYMNGLKKGDSLNSDYYPKNQNNALNCIFSYLKGTSNYIKDRVEEKLKESDNFKNRGFKDFRKKEAKKMRDDQLKKQKINFLHQAFRYRGKANYRDCIYFLENNTDNRINYFIDDLEFVARKFFMMSSFYLSKRIKRVEWLSFINSLPPESKSYFIN